MVKKFVIENPVENYFKEDVNKNKKLSVKTLSKKLNMRKRDVYFYIFNSSALHRVKPFDVGNLASRSRVFEYYTV